MVNHTPISCFYSFEANFAKFWKLTYSLEQQCSTLSVIVPTWKLIALKETCSIGCSLHILLCTSKLIKFNNFAKKQNFQKTRGKYLFAQKVHIEWSSANYKIKFGWTYENWGLQNKPGFMKLLSSSIIDV